MHSSSITNWFIKDKTGEQIGETEGPQYLPHPFLASGCISKIVEKRFKFPNFADPDVSAEDLGHHAGYYTIQHSYAASQSPSSPLVVPIITATATASQSYSPLRSPHRLAIWYQKSIELLILKLPFKRLVHEIAQDFKVLLWVIVARSSG
ncbi:hypothetical protein CsSME_00025990 [Camellia sinensis var. sinensis]